MGQASSQLTGGNARCVVRASLRTARTHRSVTMSSTAPKVVHWLNLRAKRPSCASRAAPPHQRTALSRSRAAARATRTRRPHQLVAHEGGEVQRKRRLRVGESVSESARNSRDAGVACIAPLSALHCASGHPPQRPRAATMRRLRRLRHRRAQLPLRPRGASDSACVRVGPARAGRATAPGRQPRSRTAPGCRPALRWLRRTDEVGDVERNVAVARQEAAAGALLRRLGDGLCRRRRRRSARAPAGAGRHASGAAARRHGVGMGRGCDDRALIWRR
jgi:hypothetical protein